MRLFATLARQGVGATPSGGRSRELSDSLRSQVPARFVAVGEALAAGRDVEGVCSVTGRELARDGVDMAAALEGLRQTWDAVAGREPDFAATHALSLAWSEETLAYLHQLSCEDPLTGLASLAHLRARLSEVYRGVEQRDASITTSHALVVVDLPRNPTRDHFERTLRTVRAAELVRLVFPGSETISEIAGQRLVVLTARSAVLGRKVAALRTLLADVVDGDGSVLRIWIEGLPPADDAAGALLDELART